MFPGADGQAPSTKPLDIIKMLIFPAVLYFSKQIDLKDPDNIQKCQIFFGSGKQFTTNFPYIDTILTPVFSMH